MDANLGQVRANEARSPRALTRLSFREAIELPPGPDLNAFVSNTIVGSSSNWAEYSTNAAAASALREIMAARDWDLDIEPIFGGLAFVAEFISGDWYPLILPIIGNTAPEAITRAAISASSIRETTDDRFNELEFVLWTKDPRRGRRWKIDSMAFYLLDEVNFFLTCDSVPGGSVVPADELRKVPRRLRDTREQSN